MPPRYLVYTLISSHLLPRLKSEVEAQSTPSSGSNGVTGASGPGPEDHRSGYHHAQYHALLTSHHLISPTKRRNLQQWSSSFSVSGFAKVGYPGVIYVYGAQEFVEEFVGNVKAMQWLALRVRFVEALPPSVSGDAGQGEPRHGASPAGTGNAGDGGGNGCPSSRDHPTRRWAEVEKVGEVVEEMKRMGREEYIVQMGIGSLGSGASASR